MNGRKLKEVLRDSFSDESLRQLTTAIYDGFDAAFRDANATHGDFGERRGAFESSHAAWMHGFGRKAFVDKALYNAAKKCGLSATIDSNSNDSCPHIVIASGQVVLTPHYVRTQGEIVRQADYRENYFRDPQLTMAFVHDAADVNDSQFAGIDQSAYAFLIYGESTKPRYPAFADIVFPIKCCTEYHGTRLSLLQMFPDIVSQRLGDRVAGSELIPDHDLVLKPKPKES